MPNQGHKRGKKCRDKHGDPNDWFVCEGYNETTGTYKVKFSDGKFGWYPPQDLIWK